MNGIRATLIAGAIALVLAILLLGQCQKARTAGAEASLSAKTGAAGVVAGGEAVNAVAGASERQAATDEITRENADAIRSAPGAGQLVDPAAASAGLVGLCRRAAYRSDPKCLRFTPAGSVADAGAGGAAANQ